MYVLTSTGCSYTAVGGWDGWVSTVRMKQQVWLSIHICTKIITWGYWRQWWLDDLVDRLFVGCGGRPLTDHKLKNVDFDVTVPYTMKTKTCHAADLVAITTAGEARVITMHQVTYTGRETAIILDHTLLCLFGQSVLSNMFKNNLLTTRTWFLRGHWIFLRHLNTTSRLL